MKIVIVNVRKDMAFISLDKTTYNYMQINESKNKFIFSVYVLGVPGGLEEILRKKRVDLFHV